MELLVGRSNEQNKKNSAKIAQLEEWIEDHWGAIDAIYTLMETDSSYPEGCGEAWYHTRADFEPYGGNLGVIINLRIPEKGRLEMIIEDEKGEEYSELVGLALGVPGT